MVKVRPGDTVDGLAKGLGVPSSALIGANQTGGAPLAGRDPNLIRPGENLVIPQGWDGTWKVRPGDTLGAINDRLNGTTTVPPGALPPGRDPNLIKPGERLPLVDTRPPPATSGGTTTPTCTPGIGSCQGPVDPNSPVGKALAAAPPNGTALPPGQSVQPGSLLPDWWSAAVKPGESAVQNVVGKFNRYQRTLRDATTRHLIATDQMRGLAGSLRSSRLPGTNGIAGVADRYGDWRYSRALRYGALSDRLDQITKQGFGGIKDAFTKVPVTLRDPKTGLLGQRTWLGIHNVGVHGHLPENVQRAANLTLADPLNRINPGGRLDRVKTALGLGGLTDRANFPNGTNPAITNSPSVVKAKAIGAPGDPSLPVAENLKRVGGARLLETARRGLTKMSGPVSLAFGVVDVIDQVHGGKSLTEAIGKTGSGIAVSGGASALASAGIAAMVPGAGWAVAGGIVAGAYIGDAWSRSGAGDAVGKGFDSAGKAFGQGDVLGGVGAAGKGLAQGVGKLGGQIGEDAANAGGWVGDRAKDVGGAIADGASNVWHGLFG